MREIQLATVEVAHAPISVPTSSSQHRFGGHGPEGSAGRGRSVEGDRHNEEIRCEEAKRGGVQGAAVAASPGAGKAELMVDHDEEDATKLVRKRWRNSACHIRQTEKVHFWLYVFPAHRDPPPRLTSPLLPPTLGFSYLLMGGVGGASTSQTCSSSRLC